MKFVLTASSVSLAYPSNKSGRQIDVDDFSAWRFSNLNHHHLRIKSYVYIICQSKALAPIESRVGKVKGKGRELKKLFTLVILLGKLIETTVGTKLLFLELLMMVILFIQETAYSWTLHKSIDLNILIITLYPH